MKPKGKDKQPAWSPHSKTGSPNDQFPNMADKGPGPAWKTGSKKAVPQDKPKPEKAKDSAYFTYKMTWWSKKDQTAAGMYADTNLEKPDSLWADAASYEKGVLLRLGLAKPPEIKTLSLDDVPDRIARPFAKFKESL
jgi:hypothetical protein